MPSARVAILDPLGRHAGFHYYTEGLASGLASAGADVTLYGYETVASHVSDYRTVSAFEGLYGAAPAWRRAMRYLRGLASALVDARRRDVRLMHIHCFHYDAREVLAAIAIKLFGLRLVVTLHDIDSFGHSSGRQGRRQILRMADGVVVQNEFSAEAIKASGELALKKIFAVIPHGHYVGNYQKQPSREQARADLNLPADRLIALFFGNPRPEKGMDVLLEAASLIDDPHLLVVVAGKVRQDQLSELRALESGPLSSCLRVDPGLVSDADAERYFRAADLVVIPYRRIYESGVAIMAMSFGRCVIYSNLPPLVDGVGEAGLPFQSEDVADLATCLRAALSDADRLDRLGAAGKLRVEAMRSWSLIGFKTNQTYNRVIAAADANYE